MSEADLLILGGGEGGFEMYCEGSFCKFLIFDVFIFLYYYSLFLFCMFVSFFSL